MSDCIGVTAVRKQCTNKTKDDDEFCWLHTHQKELPKGILMCILINDPNCDYKACPRCKHWHNYKTSWCQPCLDWSKQNAAKKKKSCGGLRVKDGLPCQNRCIDETLYCKDHQYMVGYTQCQLNNMRKCTGSCRRHIYWEDKNLSSCDNCREIGKKNREKAKENDDEPKCVNFVKCGSHANKELNNGHCGICNKTFVVENKKKEIIALGKKICSRWHHSQNCLESLDINDPNESCLNCRISDNERDKKQRDGKKINADNFNNQQNSDVIKKIVDVVKQNKTTELINSKIVKLEQKSEQVLGSAIVKKKKQLVEEDDDSVDWMCTTCGKIYDFKLFFFDEKGQQTLNCKCCRDLSKELDKLYRKAEKQISAKTIDNIKKIRVENPELASLIYKLHRLNTMEKIGLDVYRKQCAESAQQYRDNNPDIMEDQYANQRTSVHCVLLVYIKSAKKRNLVWDISNDLAKQLFKTKCYYCGEIDLVKGKRVRDSENQDEFEYVEINGIDRKDNTKGYINDNVCACCTMCNFIKGSIHIDTYLQRIKHILSKFLIVDKIIQYPDAFPNCVSGSFLDYKRSAIERNKHFELSEDEFSAIIVNDCYICGKETFSHHINGVDRHNNNIGYTLQNCFSCCSSCNFLKNKFDLCQVLKKFYLTVCNLFKNDFKFDENLLKLFRTFIKTQLMLANDNKQETISAITKDKTLLESNKESIKINADIVNIYDIQIKRKKDALWQQISKYKNSTDDVGKEKLNLAKEELNALKNDPNYDINNYKKLAMTDAERQQKRRNKLNEEEIQKALKNDPNYDVNNNKKQAMTDAERQQKHRSKLNEGKIKKVPKTGAQRTQEYRDKQKQTSNNKNN